MNTELVHCIIIILLLIIIYKLYVDGWSNEYITDAEGGYLSSYLSGMGYVGHPLVSSIDDSGADLRILGQKFSSTDQGGVEYLR